MLLHRTVLQALYGTGFRNSTVKQKLVTVEKRVSAELIANSDQLKLELLTRTKTKADEGPDLS